MYIMRPGGGFSLKGGALDPTLSALSSRQGLSSAADRASAASEVSASDDMIVERSPASCGSPCCVERESALQTCHPNLEQLWQNKKERNQSLSLPAQNRVRRRLRMRDILLRTDTHAARARGSEKRRARAIGRAASIAKIKKNCQLRFFF